MRIFAFMLSLALLLSCESTSELADVTGNHNLRLKLGNEWVYYDTDFIANYKDTTKNYYYVFRIVQSGEMPWELEDGTITKLISYRSIDTLDKDNTNSWYFYTKYNKGIIIGKLKDRNNPESEIMPQAFLPNVIKLGKRTDFGLSANWDYIQIGSEWPRMTPSDTGNARIPTVYYNLWHCKISGATDIIYFSLNAKFTFVYLQDTKIMNDRTGSGGLIINSFNY